MDGKMACISCPMRRPLFLIKRFSISKLEHKGKLDS